MSSFKPDTYYIHRDGGCYKTIMLVRSATTGNDAVLYVHLWPFENGPWVRELVEWTTDRFREVSHDEMLEHMATFGEHVNEARLAAQDKITQSRKARKG